VLRWRVSSRVLHQGCGGPHQAGVVRLRLDDCDSQLLAEVLVLLGDGRLLLLIVAWASATTVSRLLTVPSELTATQDSTASWWSPGFRSPGARWYPVPATLPVLTVAKRSLWIPREGQGHQQIDDDEILMVVLKCDVYSRESRRTPLVGRAAEQARHLRLRLLLAPGAKCIEADWLTGT